MSRVRGEFNIKSCGSYAFRIPGIPPPISQKTEDVNNINVRKKQKNCMLSSYLRIPDTSAY